MSRTSRFARLGAVAVAVAALTFSAATPALAFGPADITVTPGTTGENPLTAVATVCPASTVTSSQTWVGTQSGAPHSQGPFPVALDGAGESSLGYYLESFFDRDTDATFTVNCFDAGSVNIGTDSVIYHLPTTGAVSTAPATLAANADLVLAGNCGTAASVYSLAITAYQQPGNVPLASYSQNVAYTNAANYSVNLSTPVSHGLAAGSQVQVYVRCDSNAPTVHASSLRSTTTTVTAAVAPAAAAPALAASGTESVLPLALSVVLLSAGAALIVLRRRRAQQE